MQILERKVVEETAKIIGKSSASALALEKAKEYNDPVFVKHAGIIFVIEKKEIEGYNSGGE